MKISNFSRTAGLSASLLAVATFAFAQDPAPVQNPQADPQAAPQAPAPANGGWRRVGDTNPAPAPAGDPQFQQSPQGQPNQAPAPPPPAKLTIQPGTYVTVRVNSFLSSDKNQVGDAFSATLVRPIVVDGVVVADRGQMLGGRVTEAKKAGRVEGTSRLGITLTDLPVVDGQQIPVQTQLVERNGSTSVGRDAAAIGTTTGVGAAIGAAAGGGVGAGIGAGAGLVVSTVGVLLTRGNPTILRPETVLTFKIEQPVVVSTEHAPYAFRYVDPSDYQQAGPGRYQAGGPGYPPPGAGYGAGYGPGYAAYGPGYYPYGYGYPYGYPYLYGPGFGVGVFVGPRFGYRGGFGGGFRGRR
jgi:hypothetical protein